MLEITFLRIVVIDFVKKLCIEIGPLLKSIFLTEESRCHVVSYQGSLNEQGATATHGVDEVGIALPSRHHNHACCQHLIEWCLYRLLPVATTMQRIATGVHTEGAFALAPCHVGNMDVQAQVGATHGNIRSVASLLAKLVDNGIFHLVAHKLRVAELFREHDSIDSKGTLIVQIVSPIDFLDFLIDIVSAFCFESSYRLENLDSRMQREIRPVHHFFVTRKRHHASTYFNVVGPQLGQFFRQHRFQSHERFGDEFKLLFHFNI